MFRFWGSLACPDVRCDEHSAERIAFAALLQALLWSPQRGALERFGALWSASAVAHRTMYEVTLGL